MSYIVPDKIPSYCAECDWSICLYPNAYCKRVHKTSELLMAIEKRPDFCPLIEIPTPHGRLGDLDELEKQFKRAIGTYLPKDPTRHMSIVEASRCRGWTQGLTAVQEAETVIKAEE